MPFCTVADVKRKCNFPATGAPISDSDIEEFILDAEEEIEQIYNTRFGNVDDSGTATSGTTSTLTDTSKTFPTQPTNPYDYETYVVWIFAGTGAGQYREIISNTATVLTVSPDFDTAPDSTSQYRVTKLGYKDDTVDGTGTELQFVIWQPLINLNALTVDSVSVTVANVYKYFESGKLVLGNDTEANFFSNARPQLVNMKYVYGVYPMPRIINTLCATIAAIRTLIAQIAGTYDDFSSVSLPAGFSASKGEPYVNIRESVTRLQGEAQGIIYGVAGEQLGGDWRKEPTYRKYTYFG